MPTWAQLCHQLRFYKTFFFGAAVRGASTAWNLAGSFSLVHLFPSTSKGLRKWQERATQTHDCTERKRGKKKKKEEEKFADIERFLYRRAKWSVNRSQFQRPVNSHVNKSSSSVERMFICKLRYKALQFVSIRHAGDMKFNRFKPVFDFVYGFAFASPFGWVSSRRKYLRLACKKRRPCLLCAHPIGLVYAAIQSSRLLNKPQSSWQNCAPAQMRLRRWSATTPGRAPNVSINLSLHLASQMKTTACQVDEPADNAIEQDPTARLTNARLIAIQKSPGHNPIFVNALVQSLSLSLSAALRLFEPFCNHSTVLMLSDFVIPFQCCCKKARLLFFLSFFFSSFVLIFIDLRSVCCFVLDRKNWQLLRIVIEEFLNSRPVFVEFNEPSNKARNFLTTSDKFHIELHSLITSAPTPDLVLNKQSINRWVRSPFNMTISSLIIGTRYQLKSAYCKQ